MFSSITENILFSIYSGALSIFSDPSFLLTDDYCTVWPIEVQKTTMNVNMHMINIPRMPPAKRMSSRGSA